MRERGRGKEEERKRGRLNKKQAVKDEGGKKRSRRALWGRCPKRKEKKRRVDQ